VPKAARVLIIANTHKEGVADLADTIVSRLAGEGRQTRLFSFAHRPDSAPDLSGVDLAICLGGDGTVLYSARLVAPVGVPLLPVRLGRLGFIAWVTPATWYDSLLAAERGELPLSARSLLAISVRRAGQEIAAYTAFNDGVVSGAGPAKLVYLGIKAGDVSLGVYRCDGVIVATPTGSTAYSMAAGGPVVSPDLSAMVFTPICPFTLSNRPLVLPGDSRLEVRVEAGQRENTVLTLDGQDSCSLQEGDSVVFRESRHRVQLYGADPSTFFHVLRSKLNWSGGPDA